MLKSPHILAAALGTILILQGQQAHAERIRQSADGNNFANYPAETTTETEQIGLLNQGRQHPRDTAINLWTVLWFKSPHVAVRTEALTELLRHQPNPDLLPQLIIPHREREWADALRQLAYFPPSCHPETTLRALMPHFNKLPTKAQFMMLDACARTQDCQTFAPLARQATQSNHELVACAAVTALISLGTPEDGKLLIEIACEHPSQHVRDTARKVIAQLSWNSLETLLEDYLKDPKKQRQAITLLQDRQAVRFAPEVARLMLAKDTDLARAATKAMEDLATENQLQQLVDALNNPNLAVQAAQTLNELLRRMSFARTHHRKPRIPLERISQALQRNRHRANLSDSARKAIEDLLRKLPSDLDN